MNNYADHIVAWNGLKPISLLMITVMCNNVFTARNGKVMFFTPVCDSVHGGGVSFQGGLCPGESLSRGVSVQGVSVRETPLPVRLRAGGTHHPTRMHSCIFCTYQILKGRQWVWMQLEIYSIPKHRQKTLESACSPVEHKTEINVRPSIIFSILDVDHVSNAC